MTAKLAADTRPITPPMTGMEESHAGGAGAPPPATVSSFAPPQMSTGDLRSKRTFGGIRRVPYIE